MTKGTLRSRGGDYFLPDGEKVPKLYTAKSMTKCNAIPLRPYFFNMSAVVDKPVAYACRDCQKIIIDLLK